MINFIMVSIGAFIGLMFGALLSANKLDEETHKAYKRGYRRGLIEGEEAQENKAK